MLDLFFLKKRWVTAKPKSYFILHKEQLHLLPWNRKRIFQLTAYSIIQIMTTQLHCSLYLLVPERYLSLHFCFLQNYLGHIHLQYTKRKNKILLDKMFKMCDKSCLFSASSR